MLELVTLPPAFGMRNVSPFCLKIEMLLKSLDLEFTLSDISDPRKAPKGKLPFLVVEDHLYWLLVASRWLDEAWWPNVARDFFGSLPIPLRQIASGVARRRMAQTFNLHGLGRHSLEEQKGFARRDLESLAAVVPTTGFLFGDQANIFDFTVAAMMAGAYDNQPATWVTDIALDYQGLHAYTERVQEATGIWGRK